MELIDLLNQYYMQFMQMQTKLRKAVNLFTGHFDENNTFKFKTKFNEDWEYIRFADELHDFIEEDRIDEYVRRINNEHWDTFKTYQHGCHFTFFFRKRYTNNYWQDK